MEVSTVLLYVCVAALVVGLIKPSLLHIKFISNRIILVVVGLPTLLVLFAVSGEDESRSSEPKTSEPKAVKKTIPGITKDQQWIQMAAQRKGKYQPGFLLDSLYAESILPKISVGDAWTMAKRFDSRAFEGRNTGYRPDTVKLPFFYGDRVSYELYGIDKEEGKPYRQYVIKSEIHATNYYGVEVKLDLIARLRHLGEEWSVNQWVVTDPSKGVFDDGYHVVRIRNYEDKWIEITAPDSLHKRLSAYISQKQN